MAETGAEKKEGRNLNPLPRLKSLVLQYARPSFGLSGLLNRYPVDINVFLVSMAVGMLLLSPVVYIVPAVIKPPVAPPSTVEAAKDAPTELKPDAVSDHGKSAILQRSSSSYSEREKKAIESNDSFGQNALGPAPIEALEETYRDRKIPRIADDGRKPWFVYSRPFDRNDPRPRIALVVGLLGLSRLITDAAITDLPGAATLALDSRSPALADWISFARSHGHETLLSLQMEPLDYPSSDPGPRSILVKNSREENTARLLDMLAEGDGYVGVTTFSGSRITSSPEVLQPILQEIQKRGLLFYDAKLSELSSGYSVSREMGLPALNTDYRISAGMGYDQIITVLNEAEKATAQQKAVTLLASPSPMILRILIDWAKTFPDKGFVLAPVTAIAQ